MKFDKVGYSIECFTDNFSVFWHNCQNLPYWRPAGNSSQNVWELVRQLVHSPFGDNDPVPFHLKQIKFVLKCKNVYECFAQDCSLIKMSVSDLIVFCGFCMWFYNSRASGWDNNGKILIYRGNLSFYILGKYLNFHFT